MNLGARAYLGAVCGALCVLLLHPRSRPFLLSTTLWPSTARKIEATQSLPENIGRLDNPRSLAEVALLLQTGAECDLAGQKLSESQCTSLAEFALHMESLEPDNAFWPQMKAVFIGRAVTIVPGGKKLALDSWIRASKLSYWNDHQTERLTQMTRELQAQSGGEFSWHQAIAYSRRSSASAQRLLRQSRELAAAFPTDSRLKVANALNGALIRDGARSIPSGSAGAIMVDMAGFRHTAPLGAAKAADETYGELMKNLPLINADERRQLTEAYLANRAWSAFVPTRDFAQRAIEMTRWSILAAVLPSALLLAGVMGVVALVLGKALERWEKCQRLFASPWSVALGAIAGLAVFQATHFLFASLWAFLSFALFTVTPDRVKVGKPTGLGVVFQSTLGFLACSVAVSLVAHLIETSASERLLAKAAAIPTLATQTSLVPLQLVFLALSLVIVTAPAWGFFYRYFPRAVLPVSLTTFGTHLTVGALSLAVIATPVCLLVDRTLNNDLTQMVLNEPNHYLSQRTGP